MPELPEPAPLDETRDFVRTLLDAADAAVEEIRRLADRPDLPVELQRRLFSLAGQLESADGVVNARIYGRSPAHVEALRYRYAAPPGNGPAPRLDTEEEISEQIRARESSPEWQAALEASAARRAAAGERRPSRPASPPRPGV